MSKIKAELVAATDFTTKRGEDEQATLKRLVLAVQDLTDAEWDKLSAGAQDWFNAAGTAMNKKSDIPDFPDAEKPADEPAPRRRRAAEDADEAPKKKEPSVGDEVKLINARDKEYVGVLVELAKAEDLVVVKIGDDELEFTLSKLKTFELAQADEPAPRRRRAAEDDEPAGPKEPAVGDTVELINARDKVFVGNILEMNDDMVVLKDAAGDEVEFPRSRIKSLLVKVDNSSKAAKADEPAPRRRGAAEPEPEKAGRTSKEENGGVAVGTRMREIIVDDLDASMEDVAKALKAEKLAFKDNTLSLVYKEVHKIVDLLKAAGKLKK